MGMKLWASVCLAAIAAAQDPGSIRGGVSLVEGGFQRPHASGRVVPDPTQDDIESAEDGVPQRIAFFARSTDVPLNLGLVMDVSGSQQSFIKPHLKDLQAF